jgi:UDP-N-acetylmuramoyl-L-alanyl-D-glutamate--2,6-diaminopimelate ligase
MNKILNKIKNLIPKKLFKFLQPIYHYSFSFLASVVYARPSDELIVIGVTGTVGKTTVTYLIAKMLEENGFKTGYTSTAMFNDGEKEWLNDKKMTMLGRFATQKMIRQMVRNGCQYAVVETSSEGIRQFRHKFINYDILVFTGLYPEHIESHGSFENYRAAKEALFAHLKTCKTKYINEAGKVVRPESELKKTELNRVKKSTVINADDENAPYFMKYCCEQRLLISQKEKLDVKIKENDRLFKYGDIMSSQAGISFIADGKEVSLKLLGEFNATNAVMALGVGLLRDLEFTKLVKGISNISGVPGRLEQIDEGQAFSVIVDYAFEPKAVSKLYETVNLIPHEKIIHVLGSTGGGRDVARRPKLGELAGEMADYVIVTNEDPYDDDPNLIIDQVALGAENKGKKINKNLFKILDRKEAIRKACLLAEEGDIVLITGKGSEQAICVANGKMIPWDDREEVRKILQKI